MLSLLPLLRSMRRDVRFTLLSVVTLAVGIGANVAIFSVVDAVLLRALPFPEPERLVGVWHTAPGLDLDKFGHSDASYLLYRKYSRTLSGLGLFVQASASLTGSGEPERVPAARATGSLFEVLRVPPALGRTLAEGDGRPGAEPVVVLSHGLFRRRFGGDPRVVGSTIPVDGRAHRVVGVMPERFRFPSPETELWLPITIDPAKLNAGAFSMSGVGRLRPGASPEAAARELSALVWRMPEEFGERGLRRAMIESARLAVLVHPQREDVVGEIAEVLWILLGSVGFILLIACANVANLFLVRAEGRTREVAVRAALGASRWDVARAFLGESVGLALVAGAAGLALAWAGTRALVALRPEGIPRLEEIGVDARAAAVALALAIVSGLAFGAVAALRYGAHEVVPALKEGGRSASAGRASRRGRNLLVVAQTVLALVLLIGSGLMVKSFWKLRRVDPGIDPAGVLALHLSLPEATYPDGGALARFVVALRERVAAVPGVVAVATVSELPLSGQVSASGHSIEDFPQPREALPPILPTRQVSPGYFEAMGIPLLEGRTLSPIDPSRPSDEAVVSSTLAERFWPGKSPLGKRLTLRSDSEPVRWSTIVGVVGPVREERLEEAPGPTVYYPLRRVASGTDSETVPRNFTLVVRAATDPAALSGPVRDAIWAIDDDLPVAQVRTMEEVVARSMARTSFAMLLLVIASAVALLLGSVGIYGVISYAVSRRTREIGVRMALGARRGDIARMVLGEGAVLALAGVALGLGSAFALTRLMSALLFEVSPTDPPTFAAVPVLLTAVALFASYLPAQRAAAVEPLEAIRTE